MTGVAAAVSDRLVLSVVVHEVERLWPVEHADEADGSALSAVFLADLNDPIRAGALDDAVEAPELESGHEFVQFFVGAKNGVARVVFERQRQSFLRTYINNANARPVDVFGYLTRALAHRPGPDDKNALFLSDRTDELDAEEPRREDVPDEEAVFEAQLVRDRVQRGVREFNSNVFG